MITIGIGQGVVRVRKSELTVACPSAVNQYIFILDFAHRRSFEESVGLVLLVTGNKILNALSSCLQRGHGLGVQFGTPRLSETPIGVCTTVVIDKCCGVEMQDAFGHIGLFRIPVAHGEWSVGAFALGNHGLSASVLCVGIEVVGLGAVGLIHHSNVGGIQHVGLPSLIEIIAFGIGFRFKDNPVVTPVVQVFYRCRPNHLVRTTVHCAVDVVRTVDIYTILAGVVGVFKDVWLTVGNMFPQGQVGVGC